MPFYDHFARRDRNKFGEAVKRNFAKKIMRLADKYCNAASSVFEVGPGDGYIAELSLEANMTYSGVDASTEVATGLKSKGYQIYNQFVPPLPQDINCFDICIALHVLEHLESHASVSLLLRDIRFNLNPNGIIIIACPDYYRWGKFFYDCDYTHAFPVTMRRLRQLLINAGFTVLFQSRSVGPWVGSRYLPVAALVKWGYSDLVNSWLFGKNDLLYRGVLTFMPNLLFIARMADYHNA